MLSNPATARKGNLIAAGGMTLAILGTIFLYTDEAGNKLHNYTWIFGGILIGGIVGTLSAKKIKMTAMPEMVSMFNSIKPPLTPPKGGEPLTALRAASELLFNFYKRTYELLKSHQPKSPL